MKLKLIAAAVIMAASAQASAAIMSPYDGSGLGEATFNIWDPTTQNSYTQDLGVTFNEFNSNLTNNSYSLSFAINAAVWNSAFSGSNTADLIWNVSVANNIKGDFSNYENYGVIGSSKAYFALNDTALNGAIAKSDQLATAMLGTNPADTNPADNNAYHGTVDNGAYAGSASLWNTNWAGAGGVNNTAAIGESMGFYYQQADIFTLIPTVTEAAGRWAFDGSTITYSAVSAVPVPAAAWLFGSGLIGLVGVARRKKA